eukprot:TRINITY_DN111_c4_g2_i1.p1 TRINITY_DN111_c4_g2~~TRINITY_DN111_c4_g2_i1.p1  ORF type:complete len:317 (+),score=166.17 TRINITY_DN111_c4_g2_i1:8-958(+)
MSSNFKELNEENDNDIELIIENESSIEFDSTINITDFQVENGNENFDNDNDNNNNNENEYENEKNNNNNFQNESSSSFLNNSVDLEKMEQNNNSTSLFSKSFNQVESVAAKALRSVETSESIRRSFQNDDPQTLRVCVLIEAGIALIGGAASAIAIFQQYEYDEDDEDAAKLAKNIENIKQACYLTAGVATFNLLLSIFGLIAALLFISAKRKDAHYMLTFFCLLSGIAIVADAISLFYLGAVVVEAYPEKESLNELPILLTVAAVSTLVSQFLCVPVQLVGATVGWRMRKIPVDYEMQQQNMPTQSQTLDSPNQE